MKISIDKIKIVGLNPRQIDKKDPDVVALAENIKANGQQIDIIVNQDEEGGFELIDGERRLVACILTDLTEIEAVVKKGLTRADMQKINTLSNIHRKDLAPLEKAIEAQKLLKEFGEGQEEMAAAVLGLTKTEMKLLANLQKLSPKWIKALKEGGRFVQVSTKHLALIARLPVNVQDGKFQEIERFLFYCSVVVPLKKFSDCLAAETRTIKTFPFERGACTKCDKTTVAQIDLFPEVKLNNEKCLDPDCYEKKLTAYLIKAIRDAKAEYGKSLAIIGQINCNSPLYKEIEGMNVIYNDEYLKAGESADKRSFPVIYLSGSAAGKVFWRKFKKDAGGKITGETPEEVEAQKKAGKERKGLIEKGKGLIAAIEEFWKAKKEALKNYLTQNTLLAQKIILWEAYPTDWKLIHTPKEKIPEAFAARAVGIIQEHLQYAGRPGDIPFKAYYGEAEQVAKLINVDFEFIYEKHNPEEKKEVKEKKAVKK